MTEAAPPKPFFTRRRVIVGAVVLLVIVAVLGVGLGVFDKDSGTYATVQIVGFTGEAYDTPLAILIVSNATRKHVSLINQELYQLFDVPPLPKHFCNPLRWSTDQWAPAQGKSFLRPGENTMLTAQLPFNGGVVSVPVLIRVMPDSLYWKSQSLQKAWWRILPPKGNYKWASCDQLIQCPKLLPDGTVEPPRLVSAPGAKP